MAATPFIEQQANVKEYNYDMWISTILDDDGNEEDIIQYAQSSKIEFMTRLECLDCEGVTSRDEKECITGCAGFESMIYNGTTPTGGEISDPNKIFGTVEGPEYVPGYNFNQIPGQLHGQCFSCTQSKSPDRGLKATGVSCAEQPLIEWPHLQVNTLRKVSGPSGDANSKENADDATDESADDANSTDDTKTTADDVDSSVDLTMESGVEDSSAVGRHCSFILISALFVSTTFTLVASYF